MVLTPFAVMDGAAASGNMAVERGRGDAEPFCGLLDGHIRITQQGFGGGDVIGVPGRGTASQPATGAGGCKARRSAHMHALSYM